jgi:hypothetical protein
MTPYGQKFLDGLRVNALTMDDLIVVLEVLERTECGPAVEAVMIKLRWNIAAAKNELDDDYLLSASEGKKDEAQ